MMRAKVMSDCDEVICAGWGEPGLEDSEPNEVDGMKKGADFTIHRKGD